MLEKLNYNITYLYKNNFVTENLIKYIAEHDSGFNGYFIGIVKSQTYDKSTHAVIVDKNLNIIHDPNPNQLALKLTPADVIGIYVSFSVCLEFNQYGEIKYIHKHINI